MKEEAITGFEHALQARPQSHKYWDLVGKLRMRGDRQTFELAKRFFLSHNQRRRCLGIDVLCQLRRYDSKGRKKSKAVFRTASIRLIRPLVRDRRIPVLISAIHGLGHLQDSQRSRFLSALAGHKNKEIRLAVAVALGGASDRRAIETLIRLSSDPDGETRNWATFGIGDMQDRDTPAVRQALFLRLKDRHRDARYEAIVGLAKRKDGRAVPPILHDLCASSPRVYTLAAARELGNPAFLPDLRRLFEHTRKRKRVDSYWLSELKDAIQACKRK